MLQNEDSLGGRLWSACSGEERRSLRRRASVLCFFFQAEDGIRDLTVTGVQTCALPIYDDQTPGSSPVVVLSYDFWKNQLGGAEDIVGRKVLVNQYPMTVVGVAAPSFHGDRKSVV